MNRAESMAAHHDFLISVEEERALVQRLVARDATAPADLFRLLLDHLVEWLVRRNSRRVPQDFCVDAAQDALIALAKNPASFKPELGKRLAAYLRMSAQGDLRNRLQKESQIRRRHVRLEDVELSRDAGNSLAVDNDPCRIAACREEAASAATQIVAPASDGLSEAEVKAMHLMLEGERRTAVFAEALELTQLSQAAQRTAVKRIKDKLKKRIDRHKGGNGEPS